MKSLGRVWIPAEYRYSIQDESGDRQGSFEVSRMSLDSSRMAVKSLGRVGDQQDSFEVSRIESGYKKDSCGVSWNSLGTSRKAVKSVGKSWTSKIADMSLGQVSIPAG